MLVETYDEQCHSSLLSLKTEFLDRKERDAGLFGTLNGLDSNPYGQSYGRMKQTNKESLQRRHISMTETVNMMGRSSEGCSHTKTETSIES